MVVFMLIIFDVGGSALALLQHFVPVLDLIHVFYLKGRVGFAKRVVGSLFLGKRVIKYLYWILYVYLSRRDALGHPNPE